MDILLHPIPQTVNLLMTSRAQNNILLVHKQQDPWVEVVIFLSICVVRSKV